MKTILYRLTILLLFLPILSFGQGEASNWYFGNGAGIRFNTNGGVTAVTNGRLNTTEGCATISDANGNLLLYTDGITVYNGNHVVMANGNGLYGDPSSTQSALVVPKQDDPNIFYIFTVDTSVGNGDPDYGLNYSVVDISQNSGAGAVTQKNINLLSSCSEKITAVLKDCFDKSVWVIAFGSEGGNEGPYNTYYAYEVNNTGVITAPVVNTFNTIAIGDNRGYLKLSADGTKMASANVNGGLYLYDFDATNGTLSNQERITINGTSNAPYGLEFSPNNELLYVHSFNPQFGVQVNSSLLLQYDLLAPDIAGSVTVLDDRNIYRGALQLGSNGKIYRTIANSYTEGTSYLGVINNPNQRGTSANYLHNAVYLQGKLATQGLPPFIQSFFAKTDLVKNADGSTSGSLEICERESFTLEAEILPGATYNWQHNGTPIANPNNHIFTINQSAYTDGGKYTLEIIPSDPSECPIIGEAQITINALPPSFTVNLVQCDLDVGAANASTDGYTIFNLEQAFPDISGGVPNLDIEFYETSLDRDNNNPIANPVGYINTTAASQTLFTKTTNQLGCYEYGTVNLSVQSTTASLPSRPPYYACDIDAYDSVLDGYFDLDAVKTQSYPGLDVAFYTSRDDAALELNSVSGTQYRSETAIIYARLEASNQCQGIEEISLNVNETPEVNIDDSYILCTDNPYFQIFAETGFDNYQWYKIASDGTESLISNVSITDITEVGNYRLDISNSYNSGTLVCGNTKSFEVLPSNIAIIESVEVNDLRNNNTLTVLVSGDGDYEYALNDIFGPYQDSNIFENVLPGIVNVYVRDKNGCGVSPPFEVSVIGYPKFFTPNGDSYNDYWQIQGVNAEFQANSDIYIFDRLGKLLAKIAPTSLGWDGDFNGHPLPASDYWFRVKLEDGRDFNGHFSLKR